MSDSEKAPRPTSVRATVTEDEWNRFRAQAIAAGQSASDRLGSLVRNDLKGQDCPCWSTAEYCDDCEALAKGETSC